jgi:Asp/Glu/hydantoin racemase
MRILFLGHQPEDPGDSERGPRLRALLNTYTTPGTVIELGYPDDFAGGQVITKMNQGMVLSGLNHAMATAAIIRKVVWAEEQGFDAVVQSNHFDPGVDSARLAVRIPVIGLFRTALHMATIFADRIGILVPLDSHVPYTRRILRTYGMDGFVADVRALGDYGTNASMTARKGDIFARSVATMKAMVRDHGIEYIVPLGGALIPQVISATELERAVEVPVTDNYGLGIRVAELAVASGITHSALTYPVTRLPFEDYGATAF